jgi:hypothetical protein
MDSIKICETHWGTLEEGTDHCNVGDPPCKFVLYMRTDASEVNRGLDALDEQYRLSDLRIPNGNMEKRSINGRSKVHPGRPR